jgi:hypothetical protein
MRIHRLLVPLCLGGALALAPAAGARSGLPRIKVKLSPAKFTRTSTLQASFRAPYADRASPLPEGYRLEVRPPAGSKCKSDFTYKASPDKRGAAMLLKLTRSRVQASPKRPFWCSGVYRVRLYFEGNDPTKPLPGASETDPDDPGTISDFLLFQGVIKVP